MQTARLALIAGGAVVISVAVAVNLGSATDQPTPGPTGAQSSATAYAKCLADLKAEHARWTADPSTSVNPASCDQPAVAFPDYVRAFTEAGGSSGWVTTTSND